MYKTDTIRVAHRLHEHDERLALEVYRVPVARLLNRALEIYVAYLQRCTDEELAKKVALHRPDYRPGTRRLYNFRLRKDLDNYLTLHCFKRSGTIAAALAFYQHYITDNPNENYILQRACYLWDNHHINLDYLKQRAQ